MKLRGQHHTPADLPPRRHPSTPESERCVGLGSGLDVFGDEKFLCPNGTSICVTRYSFKITHLWPIDCRCMFRLSMGIRRGCYVKRCKRIGLYNEDAICFCELGTEFSNAFYVDFVFNTARVRQMTWTMLTAGMNGGIYRNCVRLQERKWETSL
jgi:hypothetical protein